MIDRADYLGIELNLLAGRRLSNDRFKFRDGNHHVSEPSQCKTAPATINQCGYCIAESIAYSR
jgi:hypothetical protein